jgi:hypothetical protein
MNTLQRRWLSLEEECVVCLVLPFLPEREFKCLCLRNVKDLEVRKKKVIPIHSFIFLGSLQSIPSSRLPRDMINEDTNFILSQGKIDVKLNTTISNLKELQNEYDAVCVSTGLNVARTLNIIGEGCCIPAMDFLWNGFSSKATEVKNKNVAIIGGLLKTRQRHMFYFLVPRRPHCC